MEQQDWSVVIPVKRAEMAKTRLSAVAGNLRPSLARAMAADTVAAVLACPRVAEVIVVTDDPASAADLAKLGAIVVPDEPDAGLNPALLHGAAVARTRRPDTPVAALSADLPALQPAELAVVLAAIERLGEGFASDTERSGTTVYGVARGRSFRPRFGSGSEAAHSAAGATEVGLDGIPSVRRDVDTPDDLWVAERLGLGTRTAGMVRRLRERG